MVKKDMLSQLEPSQRDLAEYMSQLSETAYSAGWMDNLEHSLWKAVVEGPFYYGRLELTEAHIKELRRLSGICGGWVRFDEKEEEVFVPIQQWVSREYALHLA